jgi:Domain of unknown function (DUF4331)
MSSHREAPEISKDPVADNTDVYAFVSPDAPDTVTIVANYIPLEAPSGGPNFYEFGDDVRYSINIDNDGDGDADISYEFRFRTTIRNDDTFLYNTGPITSLNAPTWNRPQFYSVTRKSEHGPDQVLGNNLRCPPCNIGPLSTPNYHALAQRAIHKLGHGRKVFAGQRSDPFFVDLGPIFDLLVLRPFQNLHAKFGQNILNQPAPGVNSLRSFNVHTIAIQVPITELTHGHDRPHNPTSSDAVVGVWASASRRQVTIRSGKGRPTFSTGPFEQVSRLANPLFNEVIVPMAEKDRWNQLPPSADNQFAKYVAHPEVSGLLPALYPGVFPNLAALNASNKPRADLLAILLTGIPDGIVPGFQNFTGKTQADLLRLNVAVPPSGNPNNLGVVGGDLAGFPNGRRLADDVVTIEIRALAGLTYPLVDKTFTPDAAAGLVSDFQPSQTLASLGVTFLPHFPYVHDPHPGFDAT